MGTWLIKGDSFAGSSSDWKDSTSENSCWQHGIPDTCPSARWVVVNGNNNTNVILDVCFWNRNSWVFKAKLFKNWGSLNSKYFILLKALLITCTNSTAFHFNSFSHSTVFFSFFSKYLNSKLCRQTSTKIPGEVFWFLIESQVWSMSTFTYGSLAPPIRRTSPQAQQLLWQEEWPWCVRCPTLPPPSLMLIIWLWCRR